MTQKINVSLGMTTNTVEQAVTEATVRAFLTQHALRVNCAVRAPCKVSNTSTYCNLKLRRVNTCKLPSFVRLLFLSFVRLFVRCHAFVCSSPRTWLSIISNEQNVIKHDYI